MKHAAITRGSVGVGLVLAALACQGNGSGGPPADRPPLRVAAASDLAKAFPEVGQAFEKKTGRKVTFSFASSGLLAKQIEEGAPFDVFAAAKVDYVDQVVKKGVCLGDTKAL